MVHIIGNAVGGNASAAKLPCVGLRLNASKPESMLDKRPYVSFPRRYYMNTHSVGFRARLNHNMVVAAISRKRAMVRYSIENTNIGEDKSFVYDLI